MPTAGELDAGQQQFFVDFSINSRDLPRLSDRIVALGIPDTFALDMDVKIQDVENPVEVARARSAANVPF